MSLRIEEITIRQQPERHRYWAEVEVTSPNIGRRIGTVTMPEGAGRDAILHAIADWMDALDPPIAAAAPSRGRQMVVSGETVVG